MEIDFQSWGFFLGLRVLTSLKQAGCLRSQRSIPTGQNRTPFRPSLLLALKGDVTPEDPGTLSTSEATRRGQEHVRSLRAQGQSGSPSPRRGGETLPALLLNQGGTASASSNNRPSGALAPPLQAPIG